ncbi:MAG: hypothetical protein FJX76_16990, partial [Armatimonadetes bacterium]|nr:hypothetical protein [Armatimonadota bacterium]
MLYLASTTGAEAPITEHAAESHGYLTFHAPDAHLLTFIFWTWVMMAIVIVVAVLARKGVGIIPKGWAGAMEHIYDWIVDLSLNMMGKEGLRYIPFAMTIFLFVLASNWLALLPLPTIHFGEEAGAYDFKMHVSGPPVIGGREFHELALEAPSGNQNTTLALALISFVAFTFYGLRKHYERARYGGGHHHHDVPGEAPDESHHDPEPSHDHPVLDPFGATMVGFLSWLAHFIEPTPTLWRSLDGV